MTSSKPQRPKDAPNLITVGDTTYLILDEDQTAASVVDQVQGGGTVTVSASTPLAHHSGAVVEGTLTVGSSLPAGHVFAGSRIVYGHPWP